MIPTAKKFPSGTRLSFPKIISGGIANRIFEFEDSRVAECNMNFAEKYEFRFAKLISDFFLAPQFKILFFQKYAKKSSRFFIENFVIFCYN